MRYPNWKTRVYRILDDIVQPKRFHISNMVLAAMDQRNNIITQENTIVKSTVRQNNSIADSQHMVKGMSWNIIIQRGMSA